MGMKIHHSGLQIGRDEWAYGGGSVSSSGVYRQTPRESPPGSQWVYESSLCLGKSKLDISATNRAIEEVRNSPQFRGDAYDTMRNNCNHFTHTLATKLGVDINYPGWVNRAAKMGSMFSTGSSAAPAAAEQPKSVFETSEGHRLADGAPAKAKTVTPASAKDRPNPWRDRNFKPQSVVDDAKADGAAVTGDRK
jgi:hypothetical protein